MVRGLVVEWRPRVCANGHRLDRPHAVRIGWHPCRCQGEASGHRTYFCETCDATIYVPDHVEPPPRQ